MRNPTSTISLAPRHACRICLHQGCFPALVEPRPGSSDAHRFPRDRYTARVREPILYCFSATKVEVRPVSALFDTTVIVFPSEATVMVDTWTTFPSRLSVSSMV
jgi:hypothetical protein